MYHFNFKLVLITLIECKSKWLLVKIQIKWSVCDSVQELVIRVIDSEWLMDKKITIAEDKSTANRQ